MYGGGFLPRHLFRSGEEGVWYDPSDLSTLFQDSAGTTPVTDDGDPVGLMMDKSGNGHHATQTISAARPLYRTDGTLHWLGFDGVDDYLVTGNIDFTGTDKMSVFAGVRKLSDAASGIVCDTNPAANIGSFELFAPGAGGTDKFRFSARGTIVANAATTNTQFSAPYSAVLSGSSDISDPTVSLRVNGVTVSSTGTSQGSGNYGNLPMHIGRRGGTSLPFNGNIYGIVTRGALSDASEITSAESYLAKKSGVTLS